MPLSYYQLCTYLRPVLKLNPHIVLVMDRHVIRKAIPKRGLELCHVVQPLKLIE